MAGWQSRIAAWISVTAVAFGSLAPVAAVRAPFAAPGEIGGRVWLDVNGDGRQNGPEEPGMVGTRVTLRDAAGATLAATETGVDGMYPFGGLEAGAYVLQVALPEGTLATIHGLLRVICGRGVSARGCRVDHQHRPGRLGRRRH